MNIITAIPAFILAHWADLLALGAATTAINQGAQWLASKWPAFSRTSNVINTITVDYAKLLAEVAGAMNMGPRAKKPSNGSNTVVIVFLVGALGLTSCMGAKSAIATACTVIDSGNPVIGALCLTAEEIASLFSHVKTARAYRASHVSTAPSASVDICAGSSQ
jgi:hypothetical protein